MKKFIDIIKKKWLIDTTKTFILVAILVVAFIGINLGVQELNLTGIDVTKEKLYSLTDESKQKIKDIDQDVTIYFFGVEENTSTVDLAKQYSKVNAKIKTEVIDVNDRPDLAEKYGVEDGDTGIVVQASERNKILSVQDLSTYDYSTGETLDVTEQKLTNALIDTTISKKPKIYFLTGHQEPLSKLQTLQVYLTNEVNELDVLNLLTTEFPTDCDCLVISNPTSDFTEYEANSIIDYINNGGKILWLNDSPTSDYPNIQKVLDVFGVSLDKGIVRETNSTKMVRNESSYIVPDISYHSITEHIITDGEVLLFASTKINFADDNKLDELGATVTPLLKSSSTSFFRTDATITSSSSSDSEESGPFTLGAEVTKTLDNNKESKLIIYSNNKFATDSVTIGQQSYSAIGLSSNMDLLLNSVAYLTDRGDSITIRKNIGSITYTPTEQEDTVIRIIIFAIPVLIILVGLIVWQIRRRKK